MGMINTLSGVFRIGGALALLAMAGLRGADAPPRIGERAPDFALAALGGGEVRLADLTRRGPVVLVVLRGFPGYQCPICDRQVNEFIRVRTEFDAAGARVVFVYPGPRKIWRGARRNFVR